MTIKTYKRPARVNPYAVAEAAMRHALWIIPTLLLAVNMVYAVTSGILTMDEDEMSTWQSLSAYTAAMTAVVGGVVFLGVSVYCTIRLYDQGMKNVRWKKRAWENNQVSD